MPTRATTKKSADNMYTVKSYLFSNKVYHKKEKKKLNEWSMLERHKIIITSITTFPNPPYTAYIYLYIQFKCTEERG